MGCGILYRMVAERIGLSATLATRRTGWLLCWGDRRSERDDNFIVPVDGLVAPPPPLLRCCVFLALVLSS